MEKNESAPSPERGGSEQVPLIAASSGAIRLPNGMVGKEFSTRIDVGGCGGDVRDIVDAEAAQQLDTLGLMSSLADGVLVLSGTPAREGEHEVRLHASGGEVAVSWFVNSDPRSLWKNLQPDPSLGYRKEHTAASRVTTSDFRAYGASRRGRSHAHEGKFREDDFAFAAVGEWLATGYLSRQVCALRDRVRNFYLTGSMGLTASFALGVDVAYEEMPGVVVIDGDGSALMHLGSLATVAAFGGRRYKHIIVDNNAYASTGGQPSSARCVSFARLAMAAGYRAAANAADFGSVDRAVDWLFDVGGPALLEVDVFVERGDVQRVNVHPSDRVLSLRGSLGRMIAAGGSR